LRREVPPDDVAAISEVPKVPVWTYVKNMPVPLFSLYLPRHLLIIVFKHPLVWDTGTLARHPQSQMGCDQGRSDGALDAVTRYG
jgi:hypothetical protein